MATQTEIINMALLRLGASALLTDLADEVEANNSTAIAAQLYWDIERKNALREFNWQFARKYAPLVLDEGSVAAPAVPDAIFAYLYPEDAVFIRRLTTCHGPQECSPPPFKIGRNSDGDRLVLTNLDDAMAEYTVNVTDTLEFDDSFIKYFILKLALVLASAESRMSEIYKNVQADFEIEKAKAQARDLAEAEYIIPSGEANPRIRDIFNLAITKVGIVRSGVTVDVEANFAVLWPRICFHDERDYVLRDFPWPFATAYATLELIAGDSATPANRKWQFAYRLPADCLFARNLIREGARGELHPPEFSRASNYRLENIDEDLTITLTASDWTTAGTITLTASEDLFLESEVGNTFHFTDNVGAQVDIVITGYTSATVVTGTPAATVPAELRETALEFWTRRYDGPVLYTDEDEAELEYTRESEDPDEWPPELYQLLSTRIAYLIAPGIARGKSAAQVPFALLNLYDYEKTMAGRTSLNEAQRREPHDPDWIAER